MTLNQPWALALVALAVPVIAVYLLRGNPRRRPTSAVFLWRELDEQVTARRKWRRPPRSLALLLQLLALLVGVAALARPTWGEVNARQVIYVLDASASMQATDVQPSRFEAARSAIRAELERLADADRATLIRMAQRPEVIATGVDRHDLSRALERVQAGAAPANLRDGLAVAGQHIELGQSDRAAGEGSEIVVFSDGTLAEPRGLGPLPLPVRFVRIGERGTNQGVALLQVRRAAAEAARLSGFARVTNYDERPARVPARLAADGLPLETRSLELPARGRAEVSFDVPPGARSVSVALAGGDSLALDDRAEVTVPENRRRSALLVSHSPEPWQQALSALPGLELVAQTPTSYQDIGAEVVVLDGFVPPSLPGGQMLIVNPPPGNGVVDVAGDLREPQISSFDPGHPILRSLDLGALRLVKASRLALPRWAGSVAETSAGPLIIHGELDGRRTVVFGFDPLASGLEKLVTFPILVANTIEFLGGSGADPWVAPGQRVTLPIARDAQEAVLERPNGSRETLVVGTGAVTIDSTDQVGRYTVHQRLRSGELVARSFYVDLFGEAEADTAPRERPAWPPAAPMEATSAQVAPSVWLPFVALCLALLGVEWLHFMRRA